MEPNYNLAKQKDDFRKELNDLFIKYPFLNSSETPTYILVEYIINSLENFDKMSKARDHWFKK